MERILSFRGLTKREKNWDRVLLFSFLSSLFDEKPQFEYHASLTNNEYRKITNKTKIEIYFHIYNRISCIDSLYGSRFRKKGQWLSDKYRHPDPLFNSSENQNFLFFLNYFNEYLTGLIRKISFSHKLDPGSRWNSRGKTFQFLYHSEKGTINLPVKRETQW